MQMTIAKRVPKESIQMIWARLSAISVRTSLPPCSWEARVSRTACALQGMKAWQGKAVPSAQKVGLACREGGDDPEDCLCPAAYPFLAGKAFQFALQMCPVLYAFPLSSHGRKAIRVRSCNKAAAGSDYSCDMPACVI